MIIYKVVNKINGNIYIGRTLYSLHIRKRQHSHKQISKIKEKKCSVCGEIKNIS